MVVNKFKDKRYSAACERNRQPILNVLGEIFADRRRVLEIGSGTGQHAVYFGAALAHLRWQPSNPPGELKSLRAWREEAQLENVLEPIALDLFEPTWTERFKRDERPDAIVATNVIHIAPWEGTRRLFAHARELLDPGGLVFLYGPFRYESRALEPSNRQFDQWLKARDPASGIRQFEAVDAIAADLGFELCDDRAMPANNRALFWRLGGDAERP